MTELATRGTTNRNDRGSSYERARRRAWLGGTYRRNNIRPACGPCNSVTGNHLRWGQR